MKVKVGEEIKEIKISGRNGIECTSDIVGNTGDVEYDYDSEMYCMAPEEFAWWETYAEKENEVIRLEKDLTFEQREEYFLQDDLFDFAGMDAEVDRRLKWLHENCK